MVFWNPTLGRKPFEAPQWEGGHLKPYTGKKAIWNGTLGRRSFETPHCGKVIWNPTLGRRTFELILLKKFIWTPTLGKMTFEPRHQEDTIFGKIAHPGSPLFSFIAENCGFFITFTFSWNVYFCRVSMFYASCLYDFRIPFQKFWGYGWFFFVFWVVFAFTFCQWSTLSPLCLCNVWVWISLFFLIVGLLSYAGSNCNFILAMEHISHRYFQHWS